MSDAVLVKRDPVRVLLVGATGLIGRAVIAAAVGRSDIQLVGLARREVALPQGARMELVLAAPADWPAVIARIAPQVIVIALGTTIATVGGDKAAFRAVDHDLVLASAKAARDAGVTHCIVVSSVGAQRDTRNFYLAVKGEVEAALSELGFARLDILQPGMLRGNRQGAARPAEQVGQWLSPLIDPLLAGGLRRFRSVRARDLAQIILRLARCIEPGRYVQQHDQFRALLRG